MKKMKNIARTGLVALLGLSLVSAEFAPVTFAANDQSDSIDFKTQVGGVFDGMPLFDGNPEHLDEFVDTYFEYTGLEGPAVYASGSRNHYTLQQGDNAGNVIPGALSAADNVQGISTDFPSLMGMGQTWNKALLNDIGEVIGNEKISKLKVKQGDSNLHPVGWGADSSQFSQTVAFSVVSDLRINPLSGRIDEGFSEDAYMAGEMVDTMAAGLGGTDQSESEDGFWMRAAVGTKHYSVYNAQWFRQTANNSAGPRSIFEYQTRSPLKGMNSGALSGTMTSFGSTNGIPNILSPYQIHLNNNAKYGAYSSPDFGGDAHVFGNSFNNGYDSQYAIDRTHANVLMILADANAGRPMVDTEAQAEDVINLVNAVEDGLYGITEADLIEAARSHINQLVRVGVFNEVDENGIPKFYPFADDAMDVADTVSDYTDEYHQDVALRAAKETIVLLKNDDTLPLDKEGSAAISGIYADARFKTTYSVNTTPDIDNAGNSPLLAIINEIGSENVSYETGAPIIGLTSKLNDETVSADPNATEEGANLITTDVTLNPENDAHLFELYDWGQEGSSLKSMANGRWVTSPGENRDGSVDLVGNTDDTLLNLTNNDWQLETMDGNTSSIPPRLRIEQNDDETVSIISDGYQSGFGGNFANWYYENGRFITTTEDGNLSPAKSVESAENVANRGADVKFNKHVVQDVGEEASARAKEDDYAVVFVGAIPRHSAGEGNDRSSLRMGEADYELVDKVSEAFAAEGKKTVVVVKSSFPVGMEEIQENPNVSAILYQPYAGQYESYALAEVLFGDATPTGKLSNTWYEDISALPAISEYSIPEGNSSTLANIDPRFTVDMTNADPIESNLTYMYTDAPVTYEFGYGLSYSSFEYSGLTVPSSVDSEEPFEVSVNVKNTGAVNTSEVVQVYINNNGSAYGEYAPEKQLVAFEKVQIAPGETKTVNLTVDPNDFAVWDVNLGDFSVEDGQYTLMVGTSSKDIKSEKTVDVNGAPIATLDAESFNVFDHSFASNEVVYHEVSKDRTAQSLSDEKVVGAYHAVRSKQAGSWAAVPNVDLSNLDKVTASVATNVSEGKISLRAGSPDGEEIAVIDVPVTGPVTYTATNTEVEVTELDYADITTDITGDVSGVQDLYVVFNDADLRIDSLAWSYTADDGDETPGDGDETPGDGDETPGDGDETPGDGDETPGDGDETPGDGDETPGDGDETPGDGDETPGDGDETPGDNQDLKLGMGKEAKLVEAGKTYTIEGTNAKVTMPSDLPARTKLIIEEKPVSETNNDGLTPSGDILTFTFDFVDGSTAPSEGYTLTLSYDEGVDAEQVAVYYYNEEEDKWEYRGGDVDEANRIITLNVPHFSTYGVFVEAETTSEDPAEDEEENELPDTFSNLYNYLLIGFLLLSAGAAIIIWNRKRNSHA